MSYIYTVKPLKEAIKIAIEADQLTTGADGTVKIYGINSENWPDGEKVTRPERLKKEYRSIVINGYWVPQCYFTETEEAPAVPEHDQPEFIVNLYKAFSARCDGIKCADCPMSLLPDCSSFTKFITNKWGIIE